MINFKKILLLSVVVTANLWAQNLDFIFSVRPEFIAASKTIGVGMAVEAGAVLENGVYLTGELNGGGVYFGGGFNAGYLFNQNGTVKNILGLSAGYRNVLHYLDILKDDNPHRSARGDNICIAGAFWKLMLGKNHNFDITNRFLLGSRNNPIDYNMSTDEFIYKDGVNKTYVLSIGYTLIKRNK